MEWSAALFSPNSIIVIYPILVLAISIARVEAKKKPSFPREMVWILLQGSANILLTVSSSCKLLEAVQKLHSRYLARRFEFKSTQARWMFWDNFGIDKRVQIFMVASGKFDWNFMGKIVIGSWAVLANKWKRSEGFGMQDHPYARNLSTALFHRTGPIRIYCLARPWVSVTILLLLICWKCPSSALARL